MMEERVALFGGLMALIMLLNLLLGVISVVWVWRYRSLSRLLAQRPPEHPRQGRWALWLMVPAISAAAFSMFLLGPVGLVLLLVLVVMWIVLVIRRPWHALALGGPDGRSQLMVMLVAGLVGGMLIDWLRVAVPGDLPQAALVGLFLLGVALLVIQRGILLGAQVMLWACMLGTRGSYAARALVLTLFTGYFGLFYTLWRAGGECTGEDGDD